MNVRQIRLVLGVIVMLLLTTTASAASPSQQTTEFKEITGSPLRIQVGSNGSIQVYHANTGDQGATYGTADSGLFLAINDQLYGPNLKGTNTSSASFETLRLSLVSHEGPTGSGTGSDPFTIVTNQTLDDGGATLGVVQTVSYINRNDYFRQDWAITNNGSSEVCFKAYHAADIFFAGSDEGTGYYNAATGAVGGAGKDNNGDDWFMVFSPITPADHYLEGHFRDRVWSTVEAHGDLSDSIDTARVDNGIALQWNKCVQPGETTTISDYWSFGENIEQVIEELPDAPPPTETSVPCASCGDVHIFTPDGLRYDFQTFGDYILSQSTDGSVVLQARQTAPADNPNVSVNTAAALWVAGDKLEFYGGPNPRFTLNDEETVFPTSTLTLPKGGRVTLMAANDWDIYWPDDNTGARVVLLSNGHMDLGIAKFGGSLTYEGVLGNLDGDRSNDLQVRNGETHPLPVDLTKLDSFGDSWRVPADESLFDDPALPEAAEAPAETVTLQDFDPAARAEAARTCQEAGVTNETALENCTYDVTATGDPAYVESAMKFEEAIEQQPEPTTYVAAVPSQTLTIGQQYSVADAPGTFRYFTLSELPTEAGGQARLTLCPELQEAGLVNIEDIMTDEGALAQGLTATNEPCTTPVDESGAELAALPDSGQVPETSEESSQEPTTTAVTEESSEGSSEETTMTAVPEESGGESSESAPANPGGGFCGGAMMMPLFLGVAFLSANQRRRR